MDNSPSNPLNLGTTYTWQPGDTLMLVAHKYRRPGQWTELMDLNKVLLSKVRYTLRAGDTIEIPETWFPLPLIEFGTKYKGSSIHGERV